jgi:pimeloyl-ACP methyl ester carboxylesterase
VTLPTARRTIAREVNRAVVDGIGLAYEEAGAGDAVVCIHGAFIADAFRPLLAERRLIDHHRVISYHRRGYGVSDPADRPLTLAEQAADCRRLLAHLDIRRVHVVGHSFGGAVALRLALDAPKLVGTVALLEAGLLIGESADLYRQGLLDTIARYRDVGARAAVDEFFRLRWPDYAEHLDRTLPRAFEQAVADAATCFEVDLPGGLSSELGEAEARLVAQPALVVLGAASAALHPRFEETYGLLLQWLPRGEGAVISGLSHFLQLEDPAAVAAALGAFLDRRPLAAD